MIISLTWLKSGQIFFLIFMLCFVYFHFVLYIFLSVKAHAGVNWGQPGVKLTIFVVLCASLSLCNLATNTLFHLSYFHELLARFVLLFRRANLPSSIVWEIAGRSVASCEILTRNYAPRVDVLGAAPRVVAPGAAPRADTCSWSLNDMEQYSKSNISHLHGLNAHGSRCIFVLCSWSRFIQNLLLEHICFMFL